MRPNGRCEEHLHGPKNISMARSWHASSRLGLSPKISGFEVRISKPEFWNSKLEFRSLKPEIAKFEVRISKVESRFAKFRGSKIWISKHIFRTKCEKSMNFESGRLRGWKWPFRMWKWTFRRWKWPFRKSQFRSKSRKSTSKAIFREKDASFESYAETLELYTRVCPPKVWPNL